MRRIFFLILFNMFSIFLFTQNIEGKWMFESILSVKHPEKENLKPISSDDYIIFKSNNSFNYKISKINLFANGEWEIAKDLLILHYNQPNDTIRKYEIKITENKLVLSNSISPLRRCPRGV